jgi:hypothetical protein
MDKEQAVICVWMDNYGWCSRGTGKTFKKWFFHRNDIVNDGEPAVGKSVEFDQAPFQNGRCPNAKNVVILESPNTQTTSAQNADKGGK